MVVFARSAGANHPPAVPTTTLPSRSPPCWCRCCCSSPCPSPPCPPSRSPAGTTVTTSASGTTVTVAAAGVVRRRRVRRGAGHAGRVGVPSVALVALLMLTTTVSVAVRPLTRLRRRCPRSRCCVALASPPAPATLSTFARRHHVCHRDVAAVLGPAFTTTIAKLMVELAVFPLGWLRHLAHLRSATAFRHHQCRRATLFVGVLSAVVVVTVLVAVTLLTGTVKVKVNWIEAPGARSVSVVFAGAVVLITLHRAHHHAASHVPPPCWCRCCCS